ncbi:hemicentin-1-like [Cololabis saira]|uniref:hemicentin-1-like n=1 Tax=Cololabis saira TaxID=129043 RepID=UPI002AD271C4|nr:hemicentin-1-like [Cololabis saira]
MKVSCSSERGDSPQYSWTLDGNTLTDSELLSGTTETNIIILKQNLSGRLVCSVRNHISRVSNETILTTCGAETFCDDRWNGSQCYGALGGTVVLQLMDNASEIPRYQWRKGRTIILDGRNNIITNTMETRFVFIPTNGTFRINNLIRTDGGQYTLELQDSDGQKAGKQTLQLFIQAPVSSVLLVSECLSEGQMKVSCSSEGGDSPQYSWTLDGNTLTDSELLSGTTETKIIILKQNLSGRLVCSVRNHISRVSNETILTTCGFIFINCTSDGKQISKWVFKENNTLCIEPTTVPTTVGKETESFKPSTINTSSNQTMNHNTEEPWYLNLNNVLILAGVLSVLLVSLLVGAAVICTRRKTQNNKEEEDDQELTYADVRVVQRQKRQVVQRAEEEVEYGQVKFTKRPEQTQAAADECVYAKVQKGS